MLRGTDVMDIYVCLAPWRGEIDNIKNVHGTALCGMVYNIWHVSGVDPFWAPLVFYTYFYNHARRLSRSPNGFFKRLWIKLFRSSNVFFKPLWVQVAVSEVKRPLHGRFGSETAKNLTAIHLTDIPQRTQVPVRVQRSCNGRGRWSKLPGRTWRYTVCAQ
jgi:hypothetical protein